MSLPAFLYMFMTSLTVYFGVGVPVPKKACAEEHDWVAWQVQNQHGATLEARMLFGFSEQLKP
eukprot:CAMPEP_0172740944 /NCGR_PEP_ID=MMETSP1074-20121228/125983_1 /TAXON_ID=2916 /ORGANISM="Ceratium fusus, Strain PA161109" /LENGTH=62 /DNA_ID=CAMNT_0013571169 /DNA_START=635 /DNA_END=820 /DNA_ORIENTATION=-